MTIFEAVLTEVSGRRAAELRFRLNRFDHQPRRVLLIEEVRQASATLLPFVWRFAHESTLAPRGFAAVHTPDGAPVLTVVAAPGVSVQLDGFPNDAYMAKPGLPDVNIYRVQDPAVLPRLASDTRAAHLLGTYEVSDHPLVAELPGAEPGDAPTTVTMVLDPESHFIVEQSPSTVVINHVGSGDQWTIDVPEFAKDPRTPQDALARYAFEIDVEARPGDVQRPMLKIVRTPSVDVTLMQRNVRVQLFGKVVNPHAPFAYAALWEVDHIHQVPPPGAPIEPGAGWRRRGARVIANPQEQALALEQTLMDVAVGFIPIVGDAVDVAELLYGVVTGRDKWGRPLSMGDLALLGIGAVLPFVGGAALKGTRRLIQRFAEHADEAAELVKRVERASLSIDDRTVIQLVEDMVKAGQRVPTELWNQASSILRRIPGPQPTIGVLLNADGTGFAHTELQAAYQRYSTNQTRQKKGVKDAVEWAHATRGRPRELFITLLGPDYAQRLGKVDAPPMNLLDIPRPVKLSGELLGTYRDTALKSERLWERLGKLLAEPPDPGAASIGLLRRWVSAGRFRILKGNLAEIFSMPIQRAVLARIAKDHPTALLVSGVRVRLMGKGNKLSASKLFSDNIIIVKKGNRVRVLAVFEVKSGYKGPQEAAEQIFEWIEDRFTDGSELVLPKGSTLTSTKGRIWTSKRELSFTWKPSDVNVPTVTGLASAGERHLITARGSSALGVDSGTRVASTVTSHTLPQTSKELDYLCGDILLGRPAAAQTGLLPAAP